MWFQFRDEEPSASNLTRARLAAPEDKSPRGGPRACVYRADQGWQPKTPSHSVMCGAARKQQKVSALNSIPQSKGTLEENEFIYVNKSFKLLGNSVPLYASEPPLLSTAHQAGFPKTAG